MSIYARSPSGTPLKTAFAISLASVLVLTSSIACADETHARQILKAMSDYVAAQDAFSFDYDATLDVVTSEGQVIGIASSGSMSFNRPDKIHATRHGGFASVSMNFDGKTLTILGKNLNVFTQLEIPGTVDHLIDELKDTYNLPLPAADLLLSNSYEVLMKDVIDVKDLGSGVIGGVECDSLAFRTEEVDWQIWIAQGDRPHVCRYVITSKLIENGPQYAVQLRNWKEGAEVAAFNYTFENTTDAEQVDIKNLKGAGDLPEIFVVEEGESE